MIHGLVVNFLRGTELYDRALVKDGDTIRERERFVLIVGNEDKSNAKFSLNLLKLNLHLFSELEVQCAERFVEEKYLRFNDYRPS